MMYVKYNFVCSKLHQYFIYTIFSQVSSKLNELELLELRKIEV